MKHSYQTRRLLALRDMRHDGQNVVAGGEVFATDTDASYLVRMGHARDPQDAPSPPTAAPSPRRGPGRPSKTEIAARAPAPGIENVPEKTAAADHIPPGADAADGVGAGESGDDAAV